MMTHLSINEVARRLGISRQAVHYKIKTGKIKAVRLGRYFYVDPRELNGVKVKNAFAKR